MAIVRFDRKLVQARAAITLIEVMFAMLVAVVGLLGIASLIPLAARNARESNSFNFVQGAGQGWYQEFTARGLNDYGAWRALQDYKVGALNPQFVNMAHTALVTPTYSTVTTNTVNRVWTQQAICLDPYFFTDSGVSSEISAAISSGTIPFTANHQAFRPAVFPYYQDGHNPVDDAFAPANPWPDQPRMVRVTLDAPMLPMSSLRQVNRQYADLMFSANDDFSVFADEKQKDLPATRLFTTTGGATPAFVKAVSDRKYSWMATLMPREPVAVNGSTASTIETDFSLSIVVFQHRDLSWIDPNDMLPGNAENKPSGERLVWVYPLTGDFIGGNGGRVRIISNAAVKDRLSIGDWIMLGKHYAVDPSNSSNLFAYFRWHRIVAVDAESQTGQLDVDRDGDGVGEIVDARTDPFGNGATTKVWSRDVVLEGPDWAFAGNPTTGTLMSNVITVIDRSTIIP